MSRIGICSRPTVFARLCAFALICLATECIRHASAFQPLNSVDPISAGAPPQLANDDTASQTLTVSGDVVAEDGSPSPFGVVVDCDCGQGYKREIQVDVSGHFSFQISRIGTSSGTLSSFNAENGSIGDTPNKSVRLEVNFCDLRARLQGYRSSVVRINVDPSADRIDVSKIVLHPSKKNKVSVVSLTSLKAPKNARKAMKQAQRALQKSDFEAAAVSLKKALEIYPNYAEAWYGLGLIEDKRNRRQEAQNAFEKAVAADPNYVLPCLGLATLSWKRQQWQAMMTWSDRALQLDLFGFPEAYFLNSLALFQLGNLDAAETIARKEPQIDPAHRFAQIHLLLSDILLAKKDVAGSVQELRNYLQFAPKAPEALRIRQLLLAREKQATASGQSVNR